MDKKLFEILVCPITKGKLIYLPEKQELISKQIKLAFPIKDGIPILLESQARTISQEEYDALS
ncbi:MAG: Trm112 family protein [Neisseriaceae bacterium]|nr:MAG: Trm112 family protein [Neisseriaceae bacterium]